MSERNCLNPQHHRMECECALVAVAQREKDVARQALQRYDAAVAENAQLRARVAELEAALQPFAEWAKGWHANWPDHLPVNETKTDDSPTLGDCRRAAALLKAAPEQ